MSRSFSVEFLKRLESGWREIFEILHKIGKGVISDIALIEVTFLDDDEMARLHGEFLGDATTTDVITFDHGELLIGVETAKRQSLEFETSIHREIALYGIHGMLHLAGFDDRDSPKAKLMERRQKDLFSKVFADLV
ncbi:rRNA maturation RNase YbeY [Akkermansiaceae bacterium]|nr:rRNA maturation RNase YbeY [Akkermansiaceae bacterium]MDA8958530.1 rRNA maturation RNase YbeY [bacterium]MDA7521628.1 rRNA maturation RNase YbeY [Akkermansiaceae bacterium]MDA7624075.1 rRNA maturation RNase YbeY [Akkermansiaceae bacterium]MDA7678128.1 rRNA maturation RNase YbeY [Akkermansiaceae bacterium]